jgi:hypothetical protein
MPKMNAINSRESKTIIKTSSYGNRGRSISVESPAPAAQPALSQRPYFGAFRQSFVSLDTTSFGQRERPCQFRQGLFRVLQSVRR